MFKKAPQGAEGYLKFKDGTSFQGVFRGDPHEFYSIYQDPTEYSSWAKGRSYRFKVNFLVKEDGKWVAKILSGGVKLSRQITSEMMESGKDALYRIKRTGESKDDTSYTCMAIGEISKEDKAAIEKVALKPLSSGRMRSEDDGPPPHTDDDFIPQVDDPDESDIPF